MFKNKNIMLLYYNSNTIMYKYLVNSSQMPEVNGYYISDGTTLNGKYQYKLQYGLYYLWWDSEAKCWNLGKLNEASLFKGVSTVPQDDPYLVSWNGGLIMVKLCMTCNNNTTFCDCSSQVTSVNTNTSQTSSNVSSGVIKRCDSCDYYVCCCNLLDDDEDCDEYVVDSSLTPTKVTSLTPISEIKGEFDSLKESGWYSILKGVTTTWGEFRLEYSSENNNRYGYINFTINKNIYSDKININIIEQRQYYNDKIEINLDKSQYVVFEKIRLAKDVGGVYFIEIYYNKLALKNSEIFVKLSLNSKYDSEWEFDCFKGPNLDTKYNEISLIANINVINSRISNDASYVIDTTGHVAINAKNTNRTLEVGGSIRTTSNNPYLTKTLGIDDIILNENFELYQQPSPKQYDGKPCNRLDYLGSSTVYHDGSTLIPNSQELSTTSLALQSIEIGDDLILSYNNNTNFDVKTVVNKNINNDTNIVVDSEFVDPLNSDPTQVTSQENVKFYLVKQKTTVYALKPVLKAIPTNQNKYDTLETTQSSFKNNFVKGDKIVFVMTNDILTRTVSDVISDTKLNFKPEIDSLTSPVILKIIKIPMQFIIQNNDGDSNIMIDDTGKMIFVGNDALTKNAMEFSIESGELTTIGAPNQPSGQPENFSISKTEFLKLDGNIKVEGITKFTDNLFVCDQQPSPNVTALIDSAKGDLRLAGASISKRLVSSNATINQIQVTNLLSKTQSTWSDRRLKKDINSIQESQVMEKIKQLNPVKFKWKSNDSQDMGFIAQEIQEIFPDAVEEKDGLLHIHYNRLLAYMVMGMKEMS